MDFVAVLMSVGVAFLVGAYVVRPLSDKRPEEAFGEAAREISALQAERDRILSLIEELDMDHAIGKILDEAYPSERSRLLQQGAEVLRQIDERQKEYIPRDEATHSGRSLEDALEASVAQLRNAPSQRGQDFCGQCGAKILVGDRFCVACGSKVSAQEDRS